MRKKWRGIIPVDDMRAAVFYDDDPVRQPVDEIPVMGNKEKRPVKFRQGFLQNLPGSFPDAFQLLRLSEHFQIVATQFNHFSSLHQTHTGRKKSQSL